MTALTTCVLQASAAHISCKASVRPRAYLLAVQQCDDELNLSAAPMSYVDSWGHVVRQQVILLGRYQRASASFALLHSTTTPLDQCTALYS